MGCLVSLGLIARGRGGAVRTCESTSPQHVLGNFGGAHCDAIEGCLEGIDTNQGLLVGKSCELR